ncbi:MAG: hypothetical protein HGB22_01420 [Chlorobiaceae bacterium]|nr:hypothetical protein [Chlorobiaceae bacterium]
MEILFLFIPSGLLFHFVMYEAGLMSIKNMNQLIAYGQKVGMELTVIMAYYIFFFDGKKFPFLPACNEYLSGV